MKLENKICVVTGANRGIGKKISEVFVSEGATVLGFARNLDALKKVEEELNEKGPGKFIGYKVDVSNSDEINNTVKTIAKEFKRIDVLVNNAGVTKDMLLLLMKEEDFDFVINVNLKGVFLVTKAVAKVMRKQKEGSIINISSVVGLEGNIGQTNYSASKAGVIGMTKTWAKELTMKGEQIRVNAVAPGFIETDMTKELNEDFKKAALERILLKRMGSAEEVAKVVLFLASDDSSYITGQVIRVDGGIAL
ncbi:3-ketoacyl-ACP reductase [Marinitoga sp. 1135]|uniref:3-oxoacyl-[acyl-carrier-protein] reductase n=1 Tax=Marinitoga piezophila (strain DSM 14283 / JCM 11233 / KA3) TaxID=443254 RepID=H2J329_MARPK|nr:MULTISPECIES: 3-oxoacyl-[acyl-carrier-protein] reductase [Marinitoga]AEX84547.1 3-oxoacyl-(acyl-carrier-protein) reductase [Marinitoga piezophila KA3]APT75073.1 3-ketoacyl-ACP reductase [Marinitoga sp. 1137]NUU94846.1 3-ketoacyl-ACP reductase [Marinitoga sp. 1135]NUU96783.1 3-ketoacyl-ACP reductase [Marinitoga sp. 1138]